MAILKASKQIYEFSLPEIKALIANDIGVPVDRVSVEYVQGDLGLGDPLDRHPAPRGVVKIRVTVENTAAPARPQYTSSLASQIEVVESSTSQWGDR